tara:strand:+ start:350 stop:523 length:174 start_codon:yes stop_codon:yes gene_type:complete
MQKLLLVLFLIVGLLGKSYAEQYDDKNSDGIKFILKNWNNIIQVGNGEFKFFPEVLK